MKTKVDKRLFWYLKDGTELDLENPSHVDMYVQQVLSSGKAEDIKRMLRILPPARFRESFGRIKRFLSKEVRKFWEAGLGDTASPLVIEENTISRFKVEGIMEKKQKEIRLSQQKKKVPMWLLRLGQVKAELRTVRFPGTSEEGLRQGAALSDIALRLFREQVRNARTNLDDRQITLETQRLLTRLTQAESMRTLTWRKDRVRYFGR